MAWRRRRHFDDFDDFEDDFDLFDEDDEEPAYRTEPLAERMPAYLGVFGLGVGVTLVAGIVWAVLGSQSLVEGTAYSMMIYGVVFLLVGGSTGGGYTNMSVGAVGALFGGRHRKPDEYEDDPEARRGARVRVDPMDRLRKGLRPEANPTAFWQVVGGFAYIGLGIALVELFG